MTERQRELVRGSGFVGLILLLTVVVFGQTARFGFVYDDASYILNNPHVSSGLSWSNFVWSLSSGYFATWHPLTWLAHMLDVSLFGLEAGGHHVVNVILHGLNVLLLVLALRALTSSVWRSVLVAGLFAVHPLHVETVAWIADRKDLLYALFFLLTLIAYQRYCRVPGKGRYLALLVAFSLGILSKATMMSLPLILLLLDYWPLNRVAPPPNRLDGPARLVDWPVLRRLVAEKIPLLALSVAQAFIIYRSQHSAAIALETPPLALRLANASINYLRYIGKTLVPSNLAALYPFPQTMPPWWMTALAVLALVTTSVAVVLRSRRRPALVVGWFWFLVTLLPVSGIVQIGSGTQSMADRFTYVPLIGLFVMAAWLTGGATSRSPRSFLYVVVVCGALLGVLAGVSYRQASHWNDSVTLWEHALRATERNYVAHNNLGMAYFDRGRFSDAEAQFRQALAIKSNYIDAVYNLGTALYSQKRFEEALRSFTLAREASPRDPEYNFGEAAAYMELGKWAEAIAPLRRIVEINRNYKDTARRLAFCLQRTAP